jgi:hypothetical protein
MPEPNRQTRRPRTSSAQGDDSGTPAATSPAFWKPTNAECRPPHLPNDLHPAPVAQASAQPHQPSARSRPRHPLVRSHPVRATARETPLVTPPRSPAPSTTGQGPANPTNLPQACSKRPSLGSQHEQGSRQLTPPTSPRHQARTPGRAARRESGAHPPDATGQAPCRRR